MPYKQEKKVAPFLILKVLIDYSDDETPLTQQEIIDKVYELYGVELERKSVSASIDLLEELDYDIKRGERGGYRLLSRQFEKSEVTYLIDAIFSSKIITAQQSIDLANKISSCLSIRDRKNYEFMKKTTELNRISNYETFLTIDIIGEARHSHKQISFQYLDFDKNGNQILRYNGHIYRASPYYLVNNFGHYYLVCHLSSHENGISIFRLDFMKNTKVESDVEIQDMSEFDDLKDFEITEYLNEHIYLFGGETINAKLELKDEGTVRYVYDWFGTNSKIYSIEDKTYAEVTCNETSLLFWCLQYSSYVKVISPEPFRQKVIDELKKSLEKYEE